MEGRIALDLGERHALNYAAYKMPPLITSRDFVIHAYGNFYLFIKDLVEFFYRMHELKKQKFQIISYFTPNFKKILENRKTRKTRKTRSIQAKIGLEKRDFCRFYPGPKCSYNIFIFIVIDGLLENGVGISVGKSVDIPELPHRHGFVRAVINGTGFSLPLPPSLSPPPPSSLQ
jgi:hypothetical protein